MRINETIKSNQINVISELIFLFEIEFASKKILSLSCSNYMKEN
jgi:hypothetical protein